MISWVLKLGYMYEYFLVFSSEKVESVSDATGGTLYLSPLQIRHMPAQINSGTLILYPLYMPAGIKPDLKHHQTPVRWLSLWMQGGSEVRSNFKP